jgi:hypothetical protein
LLSKNLFDLLPDKNGRLTFAQFLWPAVADRDARFFSFRKWSDIERSN